MENKQLLNFIKGLCLSVVATTAGAVMIPEAPQINAKGYVLMDYYSGEILAAENPDTRLAPASLTKIMTSYVIGQEINNGRITKNDQVSVSRNAWAKNFPGSSLMFIEAGQTIPLMDLYRGLVIQSGNDASVALAEHVAGSEGAFVQLMNSWASQLGMTNTRFDNAHGLDGDDKYTSPKDMALLSQALIRDVPEQYALYKEKSFTWAGITQYNRNKLLWDNSLSADGMKTGYTPEAGYSLVTSATRDNMRLITVVMGTDSEKARLDESRKLLQYGFRFFNTEQLLNASEPVMTARVWQGEADYIQAGVMEAVYVTLPGNQAEKLQAQYDINPNLTAPITKGDVIGQIIWRDNDTEIKSQPLIALESIEQGSWFKQVLDRLKLFFSSLLGGILGEWL